MARNSNFVPSVYVMLNLLAELLRFRERERHNLSHRWTPVISYQIERKCNGSGSLGCYWGCDNPSHETWWEPTRELKVLVDRGYVGFDRRTGAFWPTKTFDSVASLVLNETQSGPNYPMELWAEVYNLGHKVNKLADETQMELEPWEVVYSFFEKDETSQWPDKFQLRSKLVEIEPCGLCLDYSCPGPHDCD